jgi:hypothetical protein
MTTEVEVNDLSNGLMIKSNPALAAIIARMAARRPHPGMAAGARPASPPFAAFPPVTK